VAGKRDLSTGISKFLGISGILVLIDNDRIILYNDMEIYELKGEKYEHNRSGYRQY
jgi:hypothetical protein